VTSHELAKAMAAAVKDYVRVDRAVLEARLLVAEAKLSALEAQPAPRDGRDGAPGIMGLTGANGKDGVDGKDGLGFEDLDVSLSGDRTLVFRFARGDQEKVFKVVGPWPVNQDLWVDGKGYVPGDIVSWEGSAWICKDATIAARPGVSPIWRQLVTKGRQGAQGKVGPPGADGKDGRDGLDLTQMDGSGRKWR